MSDISVSEPEAKPKKKVPQIRKLRRDELMLALQAGWNDFKREPKFGLFFGAIYAIGGWVIYLLASISGMHYFAYPLVSGFALIAPFVCAGVYEVSRLIERGEPLTWSNVLDAIRQCGLKDLGWMSLVSVFALIIWADFAVFVYLMFFGLKLLSPMELATMIVTSWYGFSFFVVGNLLGAVIAFFVFSLTVVSFPLLLDRDVDFVTAMMTSMRAVKMNPIQMLAWAAGIALMMLFSFATLFLGLFMILPVVGHATWHLYRRVIEPEEVAG